MPLVSRRAFLGGASAFVAWANMPAFARAEGRDPRLLVVLLRGALDGLGAVAPVGDPDYPKLRDDLLVSTSGPNAALPLDGFFALNGAMPKLHALYGRKEALIVHAVATPYRERSHFDGQNVLENGYTIPGAASDGWLNRAAAALPRGERVNPVQGLAVSSNVPLILRGTAPVLTWTPPQLRLAGSDTVMRLHDLYVHRDPELARVFAEGVGLDKLVSGMGEPSMGGKNRGGGRYEGAYLPVAEGAARLVARDDGPRLAVLDLVGWDTHTGQGGAIDGRLPRLLGALDMALDRITTMLQPVWKDTAVLVITEFGRTVAQNGNDGTDHGTGTVAFLLGGGVKGGRVIADWPGLSERALYEGRDLMPTTDLRAVVKGVLRDHFGLGATALAEQVFPGSIAIAPSEGLMA